MTDNNKRDELIDKLTSNLPLIRAKMKMSQAELAEVVGIGRQTIISIENKSSKMRWDTFMAMMLIISKDADAADLLSLLGLHISDLDALIEDNLATRRSSTVSLQNKLWTDNNYTGDVSIRGFAPLPIGLRGSSCRKCKSSNIRGVIIMPTADEQDPNLICLDCGYWWD